MSDPIIYLSGITPGTEEQALDFIKRSKVSHRCFSFAYSCPGAFYYSKQIHHELDLSLKKNVHVMLDSGAFSFHQFVDSRSGVLSTAKKRKVAVDIEKLKDDTIGLYVDYCKKFKKDWDFYVNFDYKREGKVCWDVQKYLEKQGLRPVPVFHGYYSIDWLKRYCEDGHKRIGISGVARRQGGWNAQRAYLDRVFDLTEKYGIKLHGFAVTALTLMFGYPWHSVDSATWVKAANMGAIYFVDRRAHSMQLIHISDRRSGAVSYNRLGKATQQALRRSVEEAGFDFKKMRTDKRERSIFNALVFTSGLQGVRERVMAQKVDWESLI